MKKTHHCHEAMNWLRARDWDLGPLTGQDYPALEAIAHCWKLYFQSDNAGQVAAIRCVAHLLFACQEVCWPMAYELIAQAGDWGHRRPIWERVVAFAALSLGTPMHKLQKLSLCPIGHPLVQR